RLAHLTDLRGGLADDLLVGALDDDLRRHWDLEGDPLARLDDDGVRVADAELEVGALHRGAVADALDLEALLEAFRDALDHVRDQRPRQPVQRAILAALGRTRDDDRAVLLLDLHALRHGLLELAQRPVDGHASGRDPDGNPGRYFDWSFSD